VFAKYQVVSLAFEVIITARGWTLSRTTYETFSSLTIHKLKNWKIL